MNKDQQILRAIRKGDQRQYLNELYKTSLPKIKNYILKNSGSIQDAQDIFQDAVLIFVQKVMNKSFNEQYEIDGFLYAVARNLWINKVKRDQRVSFQDELPEIETEKSQLDQLLSKEKEKAIYGLFDQLGDTCSKLLRMTIIYELPLKEVAEKLAYANTNMVKTYNYRCKKRLGELIKTQPQIIKLLSAVI